MNTSILKDIIGKILQDKYDDHFSKVVILSRHLSVEFSQILLQLGWKNGLIANLYVLTSLFVFSMFLNFPCKYKYKYFKGYLYS